MRARALLAACVLAALVAPASADTDWARGLVTVEAVGTADRRAPSPAVARVGSLREAEGRAEAALLEAARSLPRAGGGTVGEAADQDPAVAAALAAAVAAPIETATDLLPDGSVRIARAVPIEAVRQAIAGVGAAAGAPAADAPTAIVIDARNLKVKPAVGIRVSLASDAIELPALWVTKAPADGDARLGERPVRVKATKVDAGALVVDGLDPAAAAAPGVALIVVIREKK